MYYAITEQDKRDGMSREGCGRVGIWKETDLIHCYTLECNYQTGKRINPLYPKLNKLTGKAEPENTVTDANSKMYELKVKDLYNLRIQITILKFLKM
jgi:hypothetical protein